MLSKIGLGPGAPRRGPFSSPNRFQIKKTPSFLRHFFRFLSEKNPRKCAASGTEWSEPTREKFGKRFCLSGIFRVPLHNTCIQGQSKKDKRTTQKSKTQAPPPNGSGACFLFFTGSFPSRPVPGFRRKSQEISQNFLVAPDEINRTFSELTLKRAERSGASAPRPLLITLLPFWKNSSALG